MSKEKQIEELGEEIFLHCSAGLFEDEANSIAEFVINKQGYRKASEVAEEIFAEIDKRFVDILSCIHGGTLKAILNSDKEAEEIHRNMLTMAQSIRECVAELKKKYTEGNG